jgi:hypothetical protein
MRFAVNYSPGYKTPEPQKPRDYEPTNCFDQQGNRIDWSEGEDDDSESFKDEEEQEHKVPKEEEQKGQEEEGGEEKDTVKKKGGFKLEMEDPSHHQEQPNFDASFDGGSADE